MVPHLVGISVAEVTGQLGLPRRSLIEARG
jgi:hypothetical protein